MSLEKIRLRGLHDCDRDKVVFEFFSAHGGKDFRQFTGQ